MKFVICHDIPGRLRIRVLQPREMTCSEADTLEYALSALSNVSKVSVPVSYTHLTLPTTPYV